MSIKAKQPFRQLCRQACRVFTGNNAPLFIQLLVVISGIGLSSISASFLYKLEKQDTLKEFQKDVDARAASLYREITLNFEALRSLSILFKGDLAPSSTRFHLESKEILARHSGIQGLSWIPYVPFAERAEYESERQADMPGFEFKALLGPKKFARAGPKDGYYPVYYAEPVKVNRKVFGFDLSSSPARYPTLMKAQDTALPQITSSITLALDTVTQKGFLAFLPIYKDNVAITSKPAGNLKGFVVGVYKLDDIFSQSALKEQPNIEMALTDETSAIAQETLSVHPKKGSLKLAKDTSYIKQLPETWGRQWSIMASPSLDYLENKKNILPLITLIIGSLFSLLISFYIHLVTKRSRLIETLVAEKTQQLELANKKLTLLSRMDALTGLANRGRMDEFLDKEWRNAIRNKTSISFILMDVDFFKLYNDNYGHPAGDVCLAKVASALKEQANRPSDLVARYGGEEFAVILTATKNPDYVAEKCRQAIEDLAIPHKLSTVASVVTISLGLSTVFPAQDSDPALFIQQADKALYKAKKSGRNQLQQHR